MRGTGARRLRKAKEGGNMKAQKETYMKMALRLAKKGIGFVNPNPLVGAVIVKEGRVIGTGYHAKCGEAHAERNALANCRESARGADLYVTLEPCSHYGRTPPCTQAIIQAGIERVFIGSGDPNPLVAGRGTAQLMEAGIQVETGVCREECDKINEIFFHYITKKRPFVIMKYAMTADGKIASASGDSKWISSEKSRIHVHQTRKRVAAIMAGVETVLKDDPMFNCRVSHPSHPVRIICDSHLRIPLDSTIVKTAEQIPACVAYVNGDKQKECALADRGVRLIRTKENQGRVDLLELMDVLGKEQIDSVLLEGGSTLNFSALRQGIVSKLQVYLAPKLLGGHKAKSPIGGEGILSMGQAFALSAPAIKRIGSDLLLEYTVRGSE